MALPECYGRRHSSHMSPLSHPHRDKAVSELAHRPDFPDLLEQRWFCEGIAWVESASPDRPRRHACHD